ncbi:PREDICTED: uncharacterized protein LOC109581108 isoform X2 [Amphimedon queenslandica]|uniref:FZ domain-containing protein n=1 Tax=Amphimedon queenslandica TaxID=400682 RepID=A0AAN0J0A5_AMPQE|nr:PREDICTED: uncharacterized protein LOC109581108 isoform X2 [Amphimedon queenslandica]|eukprot:XP_019850445.1 PREDICTED: uncharacterized protein LOC109581108 isoform X2 [Amphimedon queenslandica]
MCCSKKYSGTFENIVLAILLVVTVALFSLPIIFYYISDIFVSISSTMILDSTNNSNISDIYNETFPEINCSTIPVQWSKVNASLNCYEYAGSICEAFLTQWSECAAMREGSSVHVGVTEEKQMKHESTLKTLNGFIGSPIFKSCAKVALPFLCQYMFPLSDCSTGTSYSATRDDCIIISEGVCADVWDLGLKFDYDLPNCDELPKANALSTNLSTSNESITNNITCRDDFVKTNVICEPRCDRFEQSSHTETQIMIGSEVTAASIALLLSIVTIILSIKDHKMMFKYPSILILFQVIDIIILASIIIITAAGRDYLYCSSVSLLETLDNPTLFCKYGGALFHYSLINLVLWWFCNVAIFFHKILFPFQANRFERLGRNKYILATVIVVSMLVPLPAVIVGLTVKKVQYNLNRFPPQMCATSSEMWFYSNILPTDLFLGAGIFMLIIALWSIRKKSKIYKSTQLSTAEKKIILIFTSVSVFSLFSLGYVSSVIARVPAFEAALTQYFECEAFGHDPEKCSRSTFEKMYSPYMSAVAYFLIGLVSLTILNFVIKWQKMRTGGRTIVRNVSKVLLIKTNETSV